MNDHCEASTSRKSGKHKPALRKQKEKPRYIISTDSNSSNNDSVSKILQCHHKPSHIKLFVSGKFFLLQSVSDKNNDADDVNASDTNTRSKRTMRKKNIPKSSTDVTDSNNSASDNNSDDEHVENNGGKSSSSEVEVRSKRKRIPVRKHQPSDDDDDEEYSEP